MHLFFCVCVCVCVFQACFLKGAPAVSEHGDADDAFSVECCPEWTSCTSASPTLRASSSWLPNADTILLKFKFLFKF